MQIIESCRNQKVGPRHPKGAKYCSPCNHYTLTTLDGMCLCCGVIIPINESGRHLKTKQTLDKLLKQCGHLIQNGASFPILPDLQPGWHLRIGPRTHWVPIIWLIRYAELPSLEMPEGKDKWEEFISSLIKETDLEFPNVVIAR